MGNWAGDSTEGMTGNPIRNTGRDTGASRPWRLIPPLAAPGALHMAIDEWLLDQHLHHGHPPTLRFYTWDPPALSLGLSQRRRIPPHWHHLTWKGQRLDLVQRPTGGRGVLHQGDLTYAIVTSGLVGKREEVYRHLCQFLIDGWRQMGIVLAYGAGDRPYLSSHNCFSLSTAADLVTPAGYKLIGSAQLRRDPAVLQHGSMRLWPDPDLHATVFQTPLNTATLPPVIPPLPTLVTTLTAAAAQHFDCRFETQPLTPTELRTIRDQLSHTTTDEAPPSRGSRA